MNYQISPDLEKKLKRIKTNDRQLTGKIQKQLDFFQQNHFHPSLRIHKLTGNLANIWSISVDRNYRMLFFLTENEAYFFDIGTHNQVYKK